MQPVLRATSTATLLKDADNPGTLHKPNTWTGSVTLSTLSHCPLTQGRAQRRGTGGAPAPPPLPQGVLRKKGKITRKKKKGKRRKKN